MFAGSGSLGFEAASRGALKVTLVEKSRTVCAELRRNAQQLDLDNVCIKCMDALHLESAENEAGCFDVVFLDPPFADGLYQAAIDVLCRGSLLADGARVIIEGNRRTEPAQVPAQWQLEKDKTAGEVRLQLFIVQRPFAAN